MGAEVEGISAFRLVGSAAIKISDHCGVIVESVMAVICRAEVEADSVLVSGGAKFYGIFGNLTRIARAIFEWIEEYKLAVSLFRCFMLRSLFWILINSFVWLKTLASVDFSKVCGPRLFIYSENFILRSSRVRSFAISLLRTVTFNLPGSRITDLCWSDFWTAEPGAITYKSSRFFLDCLSGWRFRAIFNWTAASLKKIARCVFVERRKRGLLSLAIRSRERVSCFALHIFHSISSSLR